LRKDGKGGNHASESGSNFEVDTNLALLEQLSMAGWSTKGEFDEGKPDAMAFILESDAHPPLEVFYKQGLYRKFFSPRGIDYKDSFSASLEPDTALFSSNQNVLTIIEKKIQNEGGSVAEKLQTCHFKRKYYETLCNSLEVEVDIVWLLGGDYFKRRSSALESIFEYMLECGSRYFFDQIPISELRIF